MSLLDRTRATLTQALAVYRGTGYEQRLAAVRDRLDEPLRVAVAGGPRRGSPRCSTPSSASGWRRPTRASAPAS